MNVIQYMPTASLMTYVMGLEAAKSRPATDAERKEMQRLLHEGMDAGLCGFSIQRLGPDSVQADFDGSPMVTDTMADEDILALAEVLRERGEGFIQITQAEGPLKRTRPSSKTRRHRTTPHPAQRGRSRAEKPGGASSTHALDRGVPRERTTALRPVWHRPSRFRLHPGALESLRRFAGVARGDDR